DNELRHRRQSHPQVRIEQGKPGDDERNHEGNQSYQEEHEEGRIDEGREELLAEAPRRLLIDDVLTQDLVQTAAAFACAQRGGIDLGEPAGSLESFGEQFACPHLAYRCLQGAAQFLAASLVNHEVKRLLQRQAGLRKGQKLLVEDQKIVRRDLAAPKAEHAATQARVSRDGKHVVALGRQAMPQLLLRRSLLRLAYYLPCFSAQF